MSERSLGVALIEEAKRRLFAESFPRLRCCLAELDEAALWSRKSDGVVSVGNLILHICGNLRQWICGGLGGEPDARVRSKEFMETSRVSKETLLDLLAKTEAAATRTLDQLDPETLRIVRRVQTFEESGVSILTHVVEHCSYHVGQITYIVKSTRVVDLGYYANQRLE